jgi:hypothetical protein
MIAFSGNTGGSMAPHLHFEIRDTRTEEPLNPLEFGLKVADSRSPSLRGLMWVAQDLTDRGTFNDGDTIIANGAIGINLFTTDRQDAANNKNGVYNIEMSVDNQPTFSAHYRRINFSTSRYINAHIDFEHWFNTGQRWTRLYELENNPLKLTTTHPVLSPAFTASNGFLTLAKDSLLPVRIEVKDYAGNLSTTRFHIKGGRPEAPAAGLMDCSKEFHLERGPITVTVPANALYHDDYFEITEAGNGRYRIGEGAGLQTYMELGWTLDSNQIAGVGWFLWEEGRKGKKSQITGERKGDIMHFRTRSTGTYTLDQDLNKPEVTLLKTTTYARSNSSFREVHLRAADDKTGIDRYSARIDGAFARIDFDYKKEMLKVIVPKELAAGNHNLRVVVIDGVGNTTVKDIRSPYEKSRRVLLAMVFSTSLFAQEEPKPVQIHGVVVSNDSLIQLLPNVQILVKSRGQMTTSNNDGFFSLVAMPGDTVYFQHIGFQLQKLWVADTLNGDAFLSRVTLEWDTEMLDPVIVYPWPSRENFKEEFLAMEVQTTEMDIATATSPWTSFVQEH